MTLPYIDTHCHLDFEPFASELEELIRRCHGEKVTGFILPGVTCERWDHLLDLGLQFKEMAVAPGLHPCFVEHHQDSHLKELHSLLEHHRKDITAVGEVGLDFYIKSPDRQRQMVFFEAQVVMADKFVLPLLLHVRKAHDEVLQTIRRLKFTRGGIVHCYSGSLQQAERYLELGFKLGIGGVITYGNAHRLQKIVRSLPLSAFVLETDAPDIPPAGSLSPINTPENLPEICRALSRYRDEPSEEVVNRLYSNTLELFPQLARTER